MIISLNTILSQLSAMHQWRILYNHDNIGFGSDPYKPDDDYHYAEAYALWGLGYATLYQITKDERYLQTAEKSFHWLIEHSNTEIATPSWGLPWSWDIWQTPVTLSYVTTTVFVGRFFLKLYAITQNKNYLMYANNIAIWIIEENLKTNSNEEAWVYYANFPPLQIPIINAIALVSGYFSLLYNFTKNKIYRELAIKTATYVFNRQNPNGSWYYSSQRKVVDNLHTGYILEGLWQTAKLQRNPLFVTKLEKGIQYYAQYFFLPTGYSFETTHHSKGENLLKNFLKNMLTQLHLLHRIEARLWGYGTALRVFSLISTQEPKWTLYALSIFDYLQKDLLIQKGKYAYRKNQPQIFIRHQAHVFAGMAYLAHYIASQKGFRL